jgi:hypothetical protein
MPYIVTTKRRGYMGLGLVRSPRVVSRRAVATLEEAQGHVDVVVQEVVGWNTDAGHVIGPDGGTVGPLPDGTVIEVERISIAELARRAGITVPRAWHTRTYLVDAYNARQA